MTSAPTLGATRPVGPLMAVLLGPGSPLAAGASDEARDRP
jgi:hypothetical protein